MNILALDSGDQVLSAALGTESGVWYTEIDAGSRHSELIMECVDWLCKTAGLSSVDLKAVACLKGPGSFTGLRIGYSTAKGLCMALGIPLIAIPTLDCLAYPLSVWPGLILPAIDAKRSCFFTAFYRRGSRITDYLDITPETIVKTLGEIALVPGEPIILTGSGAEMLYSSFAKLIPMENIKIQPQFQRGVGKELLEMAKSIILKGVDDINSGPDYLRKSDAEESFGTGVPTFGPMWCGLTELKGVSKQVI
jgi:tRNA threonylcarbamoyladenosine biosynthesis protein TsaB